MQAKQDTLVLAFCCCSPRCFVIDYFVRHILQSFCRNGPYPSSTRLHQIGQVLLFHPILSHPHRNSTISLSLSQQPPHCFDPSTLLNNHTTAVSRTKGFNHDENDIHAQININNNSNNNNNNSNSNSNNNSNNNNTAHGPFTSISLRPLSTTTTTTTTTTT